jgi:hypothetical protein
VSTLSADGVFSTSPSGLDPPTLVYLDLKALELRRNTSAGPLRPGEKSLLVNRIRLKQQRRVRPKNALEDPYIAAVLIAMAQARRQQTAGVVKHATTVKVRPSGHEEIKKPGEVSQNLMETKVHLLALHSTGKPGLYFYTARIPNAILERLDHPSRSFDSSSVRISYQRIPLRPAASWIEGISAVIIAARGDMAAEAVTYPTPPMHTRV